MSRRWEKFLLVLSIFDNLFKIEPDVFGILHLGSTLPGIVQIRWLLNVLVRIFNWGGFFLWHLAQINRLKLLIVKIRRTLHLLQISGSIRELLGTVVFEIGFFGHAYLSGFRYRVHLAGLIGVIIGCTKLILVGHRVLVPNHHQIRLHPSLIRLRSFGLSQFLYEIHILMFYKLELFAVFHLFQPIQLGIIQVREMVNFVLNH